MKNYLMSKNDEISFLKVLFSQMNADHVATTREMGQIRARLEEFGISEATFGEAFAAYKAAGIEELEFSCKEAAAQACMCALDVSAIDMNFDGTEIMNLVNLAARLGVSGGPELQSVEGPYVTAMMENYRNTEKLLSEIAPSGKVALEALYAENEDKKSFIKCMMRLAFADKSVEDGETVFLYKMGKAFFVPDEVVAEAIAEFKADAAAKLSFTNGYSAACAVRESVRLALSDGSLNEAEQKRALELAQEVGVETVTADLLRQVAGIAKAKQEAYAMREVVFEKWVEILNR